MGGNVEFTCTCGQRVVQVNNPRKGTLVVMHGDGEALREFTYQEIAISIDPIMGKSRSAIGDWLHAIHKHEGVAR